MAETPEQEKKFAPAPPETEITIRTMESDVKSIEQSGGEVGAPRVFNPGGQSYSARISEDKKEEVKVGLGLPGYVGPEKPIFQQPANIPAGSSGGKWKLTAVIIGVLVIIVALVLFGYYIVFPWLFPPQMPPVQ